ncbi:MAG TPA: cytochrome c biogenesis protein ResB [Armatimonadota bacterium]|nr:cytochrome c biogenesis protein ResB [Armatimonadota bacterium]
MRKKLREYDGIEEVSSEAKEASLLEAVWRTFSSMKTAIVLLLILAAASVAGTVIEQNAPAEAYDPSLHPILKALGLTNVYGSSWYVLLLALIGINLMVCSINRFGTAWRRTFRPRVAAKPSQIANMQRSEKLASTGTVQEAAGKVAAALCAGSYHVVTEQDGSEVVLYASKGRPGIWGPYVTHLSILVIFAGAMLGNRLGFHGHTIIAEGDYTDSYLLQDNGQKGDLGFRIALEQFTIEHDKERNPTGYKSDLKVFEGGRLAARKVIDVNHPLTYKGVSFFQADYGLSGLVMKITGPNGDTERFHVNVWTQDTPSGKQYCISGDPWSEVKLGGRKLTIFVHNLAPDYIGGEQINASDMPLNPAILIMANDRFPEYKGLDAWSRLGWLPVSHSAEYKGFRITLEKAIDYTGLEVVRNPGLPIIYSGFGLMLLGVFISFYISHKVVRIRVSPSKEGAAVVAGGMSRSDPSVLDKDFERLRSALA